MVDNISRSTSKQTWYKISIIVNVVLFFIVIVSNSFLVYDCIEYGRNGGDAYLFYVVRDVAFLVAAVTFIFAQFFRNLSIISRRYP